MGAFDFEEDEDAGRRSPKRYRNEASGPGCVAVGVGVLLCLTLYFLPTGIAVIRGRSNTLAIGVLNTFLGWALIGWVISLVWAVSEEQRR